MHGTLINTGTVLAGGTIGSLAGGRIPSGIRSLLLQAIGLITLVIGMQRAIGSTNVLILLGSVVLGAILGELLRIEAGLERFGDFAQRQVGTRLAGAQDERTPAPAVSQGFVTASLIFCVGPMTILGSIEDGFTGVFQTLALKATMDGVTSAVLASTLGWGVLLAAATVLIFQGALTLSAGAIRGVLAEPMVNEMTAAGGLMILGIGLNILDLTRIRVANLLPALVVAPALAFLWGPRGI